MHCWLVGLFPTAKNVILRLTAPPPLCSLYNIIVWTRKWSLWLNMLVDSDNMIVYRLADFNSSVLDEHAWTKTTYTADWSAITVLFNPCDMHTSLMQETIFIWTTKFAPSRKNWHLITVLKRTMEFSLFNSVYLSLSVIKIKVAVLLAFFVSFHFFSGFPIIHALSKFSQFHCICPIALTMAVA